jgi:hypothetical protein
VPEEKGAEQHRGSEAEPDVAAVRPFDPRGGKTEAEARWLDDLERRARTRGYATCERAYVKPCPSPGCPYGLYLEAASTTLRCEMHGPMECADECAQAAATS